MNKKFKTKDIKDVLFDTRGIDIKIMNDEV